MKKITILLIMAILCQICANAQSPKAFTAVLGTKDISSLALSLFATEPRLYITSIDDYGLKYFSEMDKNYKTTYHHYVDTNTMEYQMTKNTYPYSYLRSIYGIKKLKNNIHWTCGNEGFVVFEPSTNTDTINFLHAYAGHNIKYFTRYWPASPLDYYRSNNVSDFCFDREGNYAYYLPFHYNGINCSSENTGEKYTMLPISLYRIKTDNPDAAECVVADVNAKNNFRNMHSMFLAENDVIWFLGEGNRICTYDIKLKKYYEYEKEFDFALNILTSQDTNKIQYSKWETEDMIMLSEKYNYAKLVIAHAARRAKMLVTEGGVNEYVWQDSLCFNKILIYDNGKWDTIAVPSILKDYGLPTGNFEKMKMWGDSDDEILFSVRNGGNVVLLIYNLAAKTWRHFKLPYVGLEEYGIKFYDYAFWNSKHYFLLNRYDPMDGKEYHFGALLEYDPAKDPTGIEDEIEAGAIPDLWIRQITPNPATNQANVNIMYYPSGIYSNDLEVGLYNYMGEKIIDLTPLGTYTDHNHTWEATFDIPKRLASGMYFLNVRSGDESRTKGIAIY